MTVFSENEYEQSNLHGLLINKLFGLITDSNCFKPIVFDVGANHGQSIVAYKQSLPNSRIFAFEPNLELYSKLVDEYNDVKQDLNVKIFHSALGSKEGKVELNVMSDDGVSSLLQPESFLKDFNPVSWNLKNIEIVNQTTIDQFSDSNNVFPDILKIDTQGCDLQVLMGAEKSLSESKIKIIGVEALFAKNYLNQSYFWDIANFLEKFNYHFHSFTRLVHTSNGNLYFGDATFVSNDTWIELGFK
jgi:FkbM family methyltransferase